MDIGGLSTGSNEVGVETWQYWRGVAPMTTGRTSLAVGVVNENIYAAQPHLREMGNLVFDLAKLSK